MSLQPFHTVQLKSQTQLEGRAGKASRGLPDPAVWENGKRELQVCVQNWVKSKVRVTGLSSQMICHLNDSQFMLCRASPVGTRQKALLRAHAIPLKALAPSFPLPDFSFGTSKVRTVTNTDLGLM